MADGSSFHPPRRGFADESDELPDEPEPAFPRAAVDFLQTVVIRGGGDMLAMTIQHFEMIFAILSSLAHPLQQPLQQPLQPMSLDGFLAACGDQYKLPGADFMNWSDEWRNLLPADAADSSLFLVDIVPHAAFVLGMPLQDGEWQALREQLLLHPVHCQAGGAGRSPDSPAGAAVDMTESQTLRGATAAPAADVGHTPPAGHNAGHTRAQAGTTPTSASSRAMRAKCQGPDFRRRPSTESDNSLSSGGGSSSDDSTKRKMLTDLLNLKITQLQDANRDKKMLLQTVRRQKHRISILEGKLAGEQLKTKEAQAPHSLDVTRVSDSGGATGKSRSWFTPAGAVNLAATCRLKLLLLVLWVGLSPGLRLRRVELTTGVRKFNTG